MAIIAESSELSRDFIDTEVEAKEKFLPLDLNTTNNEEFLRLQMLWPIVKLSKKSPPSRMGTLRQNKLSLVIQNFGRGAIAGLEVSEKGGKIDLETSSLANLDELQEVS